MPLADRLEVVNHACRTMAEITAVTDAVDPGAVAANPFCGQPLFVAGCAAVQDYRIRTGRDALRPDPRHANATSILASAALANLQRCSGALAHMSTAWAGIGWIAAVLDKRGHDRGRVRLSAVGEAVDTYVSAAELAVFRQLVRKVQDTSAAAAVEPVAVDASLAALLASLGGEDLWPADDYASALELAGTLPDLPCLSLLEPI